MSKSTKVIASLGVVAALGIAAMPFGVFAADVTTDSGDVTLQYKIDTTMAIDVDYSDEQGHTPVKTKTFAVVNLSEATGMQDESNTHKVAVSTNAGKGYTLTVNEKSTAGTAGNLENETGGTIASIGSAAALTAGKWGMAVTQPAAAVTTGEGIGEFPAIVESGTQNYLGVKASNATSVVTKHGALSGSDSAIVNEYSTIKYGVKVDASQPAGTYNTTLTYTATANN